MHNHLNPSRLAPLFFLAALVAARADAQEIIRVDVSGTSVTLAASPPAGDIVSGGTGGVPATGNSVIFKSSGAMTGGIIGAPDIAGSGFEKLSMEGVLWKFGGLAQLTGATADTLHVTTGTLLLTGTVGFANIAAGAPAVTIDSGAVLQLGENVATTTGTLVGGAGNLTIVDNGRLLLNRNGTSYFEHNLTGSGTFEKIGGGDLWITGSNSHTGGTILKSGNTYITSGASLGNGPVSITTGDHRLQTTTPGDFIVNGDLRLTAGRIIVVLATPQDTLRWNVTAASSTYNNTEFIVQRGIADLSGDFAKILGGASSLRFDYNGSTALFSSGTSVFKALNVASSGVAGLPQIPATLSFAVDLSNPSSASTSRVIAGSLNIASALGTYVVLRPAAPPTGAPSVPVSPSGTNLLTMDDAATSFVHTATLFSLTVATSTITNPARLMHMPLDPSLTAAAESILPFQQGGAHVADLVLNYRSTSDAKGIYLDYGLTGVSILAGQTLNITNASGTGADGDLNLRLTGSGTLILAATRAITLSNFSNDFNGATTITSGSVTINGILGKGTTTINPGVTLQVGNGSAPEAGAVSNAGASIINSGTLLYNFTGGVTGAGHIISSNISGAGMVRLDNTGIAKLSGTNTFTGGLLVTGGNKEVENIYSLGLGNVTIDNGATFWLIPANPGDQIWNRQLTTVGTGRLVVRMATPTDTFSFQNASTVWTGTGSGDSIIFQRGTYLLDNQASIAIAGRQLAIDGGTITKVAPGTQRFKSINFRTSDNSGLGYRIVTFDADFSTPGSPVFSSLLLDAITVTPNITIRFDSSSPLGAIPTPPMTPGANLLVMDNDTSNIAFTGTLVSFALPTASISAGDLSRVQLDQQIYVNGTAADSYSVGSDYIQGGAPVAKLLYGYSLGADTKGVYLNAGFAGIDVLAGKTLTFSDDTTATPGANEFSLRITGSGNLDIRATDTIILSNRSNTVSGMTTVSTGTLLLTGNLPGGATINPGATLQIGNLNVLGEVGRNLVHNGTLLLRRTSGTYAFNISGTGQVVLDYGTGIYLTGSNTHTGGVQFAGPAASFYIGSRYALGSGPVTIAPAAANTRIDVWLTPVQTGDFIFDNPLAWTATNSRLIVFLKQPTNHFAFTDSTDQTFTGHFIGQRGTYELYGETAAVLANANTLRFDRGSTLLIGSTGTTTLKDLTLSSGNPANSTDPYTRIILDADFTHPENPVILSNLSITSRLAVGDQTSIQLNHTGAIPIPVFTPPAPGENILNVDDEINANGFAVKLIDITPGATVTYSDGAINWLANMVLRDSSGDRIDAANNFTFTQNGDPIGTGYSNYFVGLQPDGLYMTYGLARLDIDAGKTLLLEGDTPASNDFTAMLSGAGNVDIRATNMIKLGTYYGESTLTGTLTVHTGTLSFATPVALSPASTVELKPGTAMDLNFTNQSIGTFNAPASTSIYLHSGRLTLSQTAAIDATLAGDGIITIASNATADIGGNNPRLDANWTVNANATLNFRTPEAAGIGQVSGANATTSRINLTGIPGGTFNAAVAGSGVLTIASSTLAMTKQVTITTFNINSSDLTVRHPGGLSATTLTQATDSIIRIDTNSHITANTLRLTNSTLAFVPQADGSNGNLIVTSLQSNGATPVHMNANLATAGAADSIIVTGNVTGDYILDIANVAPGGKADPGAVFRIVRAPEPGVLDPDPLSHFTLKDGCLEAGALTYELIRGDPANDTLVLNDPYSYYLAVATARPLTRTAQAVLATAAAAGMDWHYTLDTLANRMGDLRREITTTNQTRFRNTWARSSACKLNADPAITGASFTQEAYNITFGVDSGRRLASSAALLLGFYGDIGYVDRDFDNRGAGVTNSFAAGLYSTWLHPSGWHLDLVFKADTRRNHFSALAIDGTQAKARYTAGTLAGSLELGRKIQLGKSWWIEPGLQLAAAHFFKNNYTTDNAIAVAIAATTAIQYRAQARIGYDNANGRLQPYARLAYARCDAGSLNITADDSKLPRDTGYDDTRYEFALGASYLFNRANQLYMEYEYAHAGNYRRPYSFNLGFRHLW